ncbi:hypothetical protein [Peribacillus frigoritolerans]
MDDISSKSRANYCLGKGWKTLIDIYFRKNLFS